MSIDQQKWVLIQRYVTGTAVKEDRQWVENWMSQSQENRRMVQDLKKVWEQTPLEDFDLDVEHAWEQFRYRNLKKEKELSRNSIRQTPYKKRSGNHIFKAVAGILVILFSGLFAYYQFNMYERSLSAQVEASSMLQEVKTERGEKARITFSDGTRVILNSASKIQFPKEFYDSEREVYLDGEAYFEVAHNSEKPFIVNSQDARVEVLGTEFNIRGWEEDPAVEIVVNEGKVSVQSLDANSETEVFLTKGLKTSIERGNEPVAPYMVDPIDYLLWTSGGIHFDNEPFYKVIRDLERQFDVHITVSVPSLIEVPFTGTFQHAELNEILSVVAVAMEVGFRTDNQGNIEFYE